MRKIRITEEQVRQLAAMMNEVTLNGDEALASNNGNVDQATKDVVNNAKKSGISTDKNTTVGFSGDALRTSAGISEERFVGKVMKSQIKECRLNQLKDNTVRTTNKKNL